MKRVLNKIILVSIFFMVLPVCATEYDLVIENGRVLDPQTKLDAVMNIGIADGKIESVSKQPMQGARVIDASGLVVAPGFIDMHAHGQSILSNRVQAFDGVTSALELESGVFPVSEFYAIREKEGRPLNYGASVNWASARIQVMIGEAPSSESGWFSSMFNKSGWQNTVASEEQTQGIVKIVKQGLDQGGLGVGFLTGYAPGSGRKEYHVVSELAATEKVPTFTHARFLSMREPNSSFEGIQEIIATAAITGVHAHIVHLNSISLKDIHNIKDMIIKAQDKGVNISTEAYPYGAGATSIGAEMFRGANWRSRIGGVSASNFEIDGKRLSEKEFIHLQDTRPDTDIIVHLLDTAQPSEQAMLDTSILMPNGIIASDGGSWSAKGKIIDQHTWPLPVNAWSHPRSAGTFTRFLRQYVKEKQSLSLLDGIAKVSYLPAKLLGAAVPQMLSKGRIQEGKDADLVVFSLNELSDNASFADSAQPSSGVVFLVVNGQMVIENRKLNTAAFPGQAIRR